MCVHLCTRSRTLSTVAQPRRSAGFTAEERESFGSRLLGAPPTGCGLVDTLRAQHPEVQAYTYYSYR